MDPPIPEYPFEIVLKTLTMGLLISSREHEMEIWEYGINISQQKLNELKHLQVI